MSTTVENVVSQARSSGTIVLSSVMSTTVESEDHFMTF